MVAELRLLQHPEAGLAGVDLWELRQNIPGAQLGGKEKSANMTDVQPETPVHMNEPA